MKRLRLICISSCLVLFVLALLCAPTLEPLSPNSRHKTAQESVNQKNANKSLQNPALILRQEDIPELNKDLSEDELNQVKAYNVPAYFRLKQDQQLSVDQLHEDAKLDPEERKKRAQVKIKAKLIAHLNKK